MAVAFCVGSGCGVYLRPKTKNIIAVFVKDLSLTVGYCAEGLSSRMSSSVPLSQSHSIVLHSLARGCLYGFQWFQARIKSLFESSCKMYSHR